jgi:pimeloyl-ACP methyl ester carboxylesterase
MSEEPVRSRLQIMAAASPEDYARDPTRWGSAEVAAHFPDFAHLDVRTTGAVIRLRHGGSGPPLLLVHGNPQNHTCWYRIAARLAALSRHPADLRGYGDSSLPEPGPDHANYSFRAMAQDLLEIMDQLGYREFYVAGHDRGARTTHRLCMDHPERILKVCLMDIVPNYYVWTHTTKNWAIGTWHWGFMAQPEPFPERLISAVPAEYFLKSRMVIRGGTGLGFLTDSALAEYVRCYTLKTITAVPRLTPARPAISPWTRRTRTGSWPCHCSSCGARAAILRSARASSSTSGSTTPPTSRRSSPCRAATTCRRRCRTRSSTTTGSSSPSASQSIRAPESCTSLPSLAISDLM